MGWRSRGYQKPFLIYQSSGARAVPIPMDEAGVQLAELEARGWTYSTSPPPTTSPTGIVMPVSRRYELLGWCAQGRGAVYPEDDYDCEFRTSGKPIPTLQSIDASDRVIYINTFSPKPLASTMRISYMVLPPPPGRAVPG